MLFRSKYALLELWKIYLAIVKLNLSIVNSFLSIVFIDL